jgi:hypothetical protein
MNHAGGVGLVLWSRASCDTPAKLYFIAFGCQIDTLSLWRSVNRRIRCPGAQDNTKRDGRQGAHPTGLLGWTLSGSDAYGCSDFAA